jgi:hypothetical protein
LEGTLRPVFRKRVEQINRRSKVSEVAAACGTGLKVHISGRSLIWP